jgi:hypothetical protein
VLHTIVQLGLQVEGTASHTGVTLLPPPTVEALLIDRRQHELVQSFKLAMLKLASQASIHSCSNSSHVTCICQPRQQPAVAICHTNACNSMTLFKTSAC